MKQEVINYQCDIIEKQIFNTQPQFRINDPFHHRYGSWRLQEIIQKFVNKTQYSVKWIGCDQHAHALSFLYCMLVGCLQDDECSEDLFIKFKYSLYQECKQSLSIAQQKIFIQHLCLIQDSKNIGQFLKKSSYLQTIFIKIFTQRCSHMAKQNLKNGRASMVFGPIPFQQLLNSQLKMFEFNNKQTKFFNNRIKIMLFCCLVNKISDVHGQTRLRNDVYGCGIQYLDSLKSIQMLQSKHSTTQDYQKDKLITSKSQKNLIQKILHRASEQPKKIKTQPQILLPYISDNFSVTEALDDQMKRKEQFNPGGKTVSQKLSLKIFKKPQLNSNDNVRTSIRQAKVVTPNYDKVSLDRHDKSKSKGKCQKSKIIDQVYQANKQKNTIRQKSNHKTFRQSFIRQSLSPNNQFRSKQQLINKNYKRVPKFLQKKNEDMPMGTLSNSPLVLQSSPTKSQLKTNQTKNGFLSQKNLGNLFNNVAMPQKKFYTNLTYKQGKLFNNIKVIKQ